MTDFSTLDEDRVISEAKDRCLSSINALKVGDRVMSRWRNENLSARVIAKTLRGKVDIRFDVDKKTSVVPFNKILRFRNNSDVDESDEKCFECFDGGQSECLSSCLSPDSFFSFPII
jgi:hypothetical protein